MKAYQEIAFLTTPGGGASSAMKHVTGRRTALPSPEGRRGGVRAATALRRRPSHEADRRVYAAAYPATANANTLTAHTITPAIVIRTVCCHMVSIPYSGRC